VQLLSIRSIFHNQLTLSRYTIYSKQEYRLAIWRVGVSIMTEQINKTSLGDMAETDAVGVVDRKARQQVQEDLAKAKLGPEALAGRRPDLAQVAFNKLYGDKKRKEKIDGLQLRMSQLNDYLDRIQRRTADLKIEIKDLEENHGAEDQESQNNFEMAENIRDLIKNTKDGVSPEERMEIDRLLKMKTEGEKLPHEIIELLDLLASEYEERGRLHAEERDKVAEKLVAKKEELEKYEKAEKEIKEALKSGDPEMVEATITKMEILSNSSKLSNDADGAISLAVKEHVTDTADQQWDDKPSFDTLDF